MVSEAWMTGLFIRFLDMKYPVTHMEEDSRFDIDDMRAAFDAGYAAALGEVANKDVRR